MANPSRLAADRSIMEEFAERVRRSNRNERIMKVAPVGVLIALMLVFTLLCGGNFASLKNLSSLMKQFAIPMVVALGLTFVIMLGSIDLSINGTVGMAGSLMGVFVMNNMFPQMNMGVGAVALAVLASAVVGLLVGLVHVYLRIPSFMSSFAFMYICQGIAKLSYQGKPPTIHDPLFVALSKTDFLLIPFITWMAMLMFVICFLIQEYTAFGRHIYAVGTNEAIPKAVGVNVNRVKIKVFTLAGILFGVAGVLGAIRLGQGQVGIGEDRMFPAQAAVVVGGTSLSGGKGGVVNTLVGVLIMTVLQNGLILLSVNPYVRSGIEGLIILVAVILTVPHGKQVVSK
ncbi:MAG: ABC transporter permease [Clostridiales bacterium]|nr:ABC transporter permease [Clostridiales bacterium]